MSDPKRWLDPGSGVPEELRHVLQSARADGGDAASADRVRRRLAPLLLPPPTPTGGGGGGGAPIPATAPPITPPIPVWLQAAAAVAVAVGAGLYLGAPEPNAPAAVQPTAPAGTEPVPVPVPVPVPEAVPVPVPVAAQPATPPPRPTRPPRAEPPAAIAELPPPPPPPTRGAQVTAEAALLGEALRALTSNPARAVEVTRRHAAEFPDGALVQERDRIFIEAQIRLGHTDAARAALDRFRSRYPRSPHVRRLARLLDPP